MLEAGRRCHDVFGLFFSYGELCSRQLKLVAVGFARVKYQRDLIAKIQGYPLTYGAADTFASSIQALFNSN
jgi:hypothetical protein